MDFHEFIVPFIPPFQGFGAAERQEFHECTVGKTRVRNPHAKLGYRFGRYSGVVLALIWWLSFLQGVHILGVYLNQFSNYRREPDQGNHRFRRASGRDEFGRYGQSSASPSTESLAHPLVPLRFLQPSEGSGPHHRFVLVPSKEGLFCEWIDLMCKSRVLLNHAV